MWPRFVRPSNAIARVNDYNAEDDERNEQQMKKDEELCREKKRKKTENERSACNTNKRPPTPLTAFR